MTALELARVAELRRHRGADGSEHDVTHRAGGERFDVVEELECSRRVLPATVPVPVPASWCRPSVRPPVETPVSSGSGSRSVCLADRPAATIGRASSTRSRFGSLAAVRIGIHLPSVRSCRRARTRSPARPAPPKRSDSPTCGSAITWRSPRRSTYPSPYLYDPLLSLAWAAAATERVGLGTSVLVVPQHNPLELANSLASLDALSGGRLTIGAGVGWSQAEFDALGLSFHDRGARTDEMIDVLRACWRDDPVTFAGAFVQLDAIRVLPKPAHDIPIWIGGGSERAYRRAIGEGRRFPGDRARPAGCGRRRDPAPTRPARVVVHDLVAHRLGSAGHGARHDSARARRVRGRRHPAHGLRAVAQRHRQLVTFDGTARRTRGRRRQRVDQPVGRDPAGMTASAA